MKLIANIGNYISLMLKVFTRTDKLSMFRKRLFVEMIDIGLGSLGIVIVISMFMGAILTIQVAAQIETPFFPGFLIGYGVRESMILEFSSTIICLILSGKIGSRIASEIGTMRITEQIDALELMGINSANFLILPIIVAACIVIPILSVFSMFLGVFGGYLANYFADIIPPQEFVNGLQMWFNSYEIFYSLIKSVVFAIIITSVAAYNGYIIKGGAIEVGRASTKAVVNSSILIIIFNLLLTQILL